MKADLSVRYGKLIVALTSSDLALMSEIEEKLSEKFGELDLISEMFPFDRTEYYTPEMGQDLQKKFISFSEMIPLEDLPDIKHFTNEVEQQYAVNEKRRINIDPGYVIHSQMVLATTKGFSHRIYLGKGMYAELTYLCKGKKFYPLEWTYPDYREQLAIKFFEQIRKLCLQQIREKS